MLVLHLSCQKAFANAICRRKTGSVNLKYTYVAIKHAHYTHRDAYFKSSLPFVMTDSELFLLSAFDLLDISIIFI